MGDGFDFNIWFVYEGERMIIGNLKAFTDRKALNLARKIYGSTVTVSRIK